MSRDLLSFLAAVRRRLWLEVLLQRLRPALWSASAALLAAGLANAVFVTVPWLGAAAAAAVVTALVLLPALGARPSLPQCALRADRHFGGHSLLATALEIRRQPPNERGPAAAAVLHRAAEQAGRWSPRLGTLRRPLPPAGFAAALVPAFAGIVLLQAAAPPSSTEAMQAEGPHEASIATPVEPDATRVLADLRDSLGENARASVPPTASTGEDGRAEAWLPGDGVPATDAQVVALEHPAAQRPGRAAASADAADAPGTAQRAVGAPGRELPSAPLAARPRIDVTVARTGHPTASAAESGRRFDAGQQPGGSPPWLQPAAAPPAPDGWTTLTAAEVAYARRYLEAGRQPRD